MKQTLTFFAILLLAMAIPHSAKAYDFSAVAPSGQTLYYNIVDGHAEVVRPGTGSTYDNYVTGDLIIPATVIYNNNTYAVTALATVDGYYGSFEGCSGLTSVTIGNSVTSIGSHAFYGCSGLTSVNYTGTIAQWCGIDFSSSSSNPTCCSHALSINGSLLTNLVIPEGVTEIKPYAFYGCSGLTSVTIGSGVTSIGQSAFRNCSGLTSVIIPDGVTSIGSWAFSCCSGLTSVTIPDGVTSIGEAAFPYCSGLTSVTIGSGVTSIGSSAFLYCSGLTSVTIGRGVTSIGNNAFYFCSGLNEITCRSSIAPSLGTDAFKNVSTSIPINIPCGSSMSYYSHWSYFSNFVEVPAFTFSATTADTNMGSVVVLAQPTCTAPNAVISAVANDGYRFLRWSNGVTDNPYSLTVTTDTTLTAIFTTTEGIDGIDMVNAKVYQSNGNIVVEGAEGKTVTLYDVNGRVLATKHYEYTSLRFDIPVSGTYMIKVGTLPARRVVVIK